VGAVWMRLRSELRARWRAWLGLALLIGLVGAAAVAAAAGVRRTETAYPRFVQAQNGYDLITGGFPGRIDPGRALARMEALPEVAHGDRPARPVRGWQVKHSRSPSHLNHRVIGTLVR
jgi:hypothetical protein